ncbi:MAG: ABC transporter ATP-binding protein [Clostridiales bacterium]|nr:ABC transporter ATP-binding protein [Clostridiales bacterium]
MTEIVLKDLNKFYGKKQVLKNVNLTIPQGMFGLLGPNGAGKTTLMKILSTLLPKTGGEVKVCGVDISHDREIRRMIGYLPQDFSMYGNMTAYEAMDYLGVLSGMDKAKRRERIPMLLEQVNLADNSRTRIKAMSGGMRRRLGIAQAILHDPRVLIVDEPTAGLDPEERVRFRNLLCEIAERRIVILSTHIVGDIEATCENIAVLDKGNLLFQGTVSRLLEEAEGKIFTANVSRMELPMLKEQYPVTGMLIQGNQAQVRFVASGRPFENAAPCQPNVEDAYMYLMQMKRGDC